MNSFEDHIIAIVRELQEARAAEGRAPLAVSLTDILMRVSEDVKKTLNRQVADGKMDWYNNVNGIPQFTLKNH